MRAMVVDEIGHPPRIIKDHETDDRATRLASAVEAAIHLHVPLAATSPYASVVDGEHMQELSHMYVL